MNITTERMLVTPEMATKWLERNRNNRKIKPHLFARAYIAFDEARHDSGKLIVRDAASTLGEARQLIRAFMRSAEVQK